jgi:DNA-binding MarR family transcriptional regulator
MALDFLSPLHKASRQISVYLEPHTRELGVSPAEGHLLSYLRSYAPTPIGDLVRIFGIKQSTLTSMLDRLEEAGFVRRETNPGDRRSFLVQISPAGRELADRLNECIQTLEAEIRKRLKPRDLEGFRAVMSAMEEVTQVRLREPD